MPIDSMRELFSFDAQPNLAARYNVAPGQDVPAVRLSQRGERELAGFSWGIIPSWAKDPSSFNRMINARGETIGEKPTFRAAFKRRRCLIPANGFYEWKSIGEGVKQPFYICLEHGEPFAFAGIWERWEGADGDEFETCAIVTTNANDQLLPIHHRMPVILPPADYQTWLTGETRALDPLMVSFRGEMEAWPVSTIVNKVQNEGPELLKRSEVDGPAQKLPPTQLDLF